jgi:hypothetical protein
MNCTPKPSGSLISPDITNSKDITNVNTMTCEDLVSYFTASISSHLSSWLEGVDTVYIEQQPMGLRAFNVKTKVLSHVLQSLCILQGKKVVFVSPKKKLNDAGTTMTYAQNKKHAIERCLETIDEAGKEILQTMITTKKKVDDVCDAFLQAHLSVTTASVTTDTALSFDMGMKHLGIWKGTKTTTLMLVCHTIFEESNEKQVKKKVVKRKRKTKNQEISNALDPFLLINDG